MDVGLRVIGDVIIDHMADPLYVEPASGHIGGDDNIEGAVLEPLDGLLPQRLSHVAIERSAGKTARLELLRKLHGRDFGADEDDHRINFFGLQNTGQGIKLVKPLDLPEALRNRLHGGGLGLDTDFDRILQVAAGNLQHFFGHGRREQGRLALGRGMPENLLHLVDEPHLEHLVRLVHHHAREPVQLQRAPAQVILDAPRGPDHRLNAALQLPQLLGHVLAAVDRQDMETGQVPGIGLHRLGDLKGQFAGRGQNQDLGNLQRRIESTEQRQ